MILLPLLAAMSFGTSLEFPQPAGAASRQAQGIFQAPDSLVPMRVSVEPAATAPANSCDGDAPILFRPGFNRVTHVRPIAGKPGEGQNDKAQAQQEQAMPQGVPAFRQAMHVCAVDRFDPRRVLGLQKVVYTL